WKRPRGRGPDDGRNVAPPEFRSDAFGRRGEPIANVDAGAGVVFVLYFGFGQRRSIVDAPVDRLQSAIDKALLEESVESLQGARLVSARHGLVRLFPAAQAANSLKLLRLQVHV